MELLGLSPNPPVRLSTNGVGVGLLLALALIAAFSPALAACNSKPLDPISHWSLPFNPHPQQAPRVERRRKVDALVFHSPL